MEELSDSDKPEIEYPCRWEYKTIGEDQVRMRAAIGEILVDVEYTLEFSNFSRNGRYCSLLLATMVDSEDQRNAIFLALRNHEDIMMVI